MTGRRVPVRIRGVVYPSMQAAADAIGVSRQAVSNAIERSTQDSIGRPCEHARAPIPCVVGDRVYPSIRAAARDTGVRRQDARRLATVTE